MNTLLGEDASHVANATKGGMTGDEITQLWLNGFESCPEI